MAVVGKNVIFFFFKFETLTFTEIGGCDRQDDDPLEMSRS